MMIAVAREKRLAPKRLAMFNTTIDRVTLSEAVEHLFDWIDDFRSEEFHALDGPYADGHYSASDDDTEGCRCVFTPNLDHIVRLNERVDFREAYRTASLVVADGWPIVAASRWLGRPLPERVAGSDLAPALLARSREKGYDTSNEQGRFRVFLLGGMPGVPETAKARIGDRWPHVEVVGTESPVLGFENDEAENERLCRTISAARPDLLIVGLGSPKQEFWLHRHAHKIDAGVAIGAGATIDFIAGAQKRAPVWIQSLRMEWLYRAASNPKRLAGRYARGIVKFPKIYWAERKRQRQRALGSIAATPVAAAPGTATQAAAKAAAEFPAATPVPMGSTGSKPTAAPPRSTRREAAAR